MIYQWIYISVKNKHGQFHRVMENLEKLAKANDLKICHFSNFYARGIQKIACKSGFKRKEEPNQIFVKTSIP